MVIVASYAKLHCVRLPAFDFAGFAPESGSYVFKSEKMFARKIRVEYEDQGQRVACPMKWMDSFSMRNFTNASVFDDTLPVADGVMEIGSRVPLSGLHDAMEDWFRRKSYLPDDSQLLVTELPGS